MEKKMKNEEILDGAEDIGTIPPKDPEPKKFKVQKFTRPEIEEDLTQQNIKDIIDSQVMEIENLEKEIERKRECIRHYNKFLV